MAIARVSANHISSTASPPVGVLPNGISVGNMIAVLLKNTEATAIHPPKISDPTNGDGKDSLGNTYTKQAEIQNADGGWISLWTAPVTSGGTCTITSNINGAASWDSGVLAAQEYTGFIGTPTVDKTHTGIGNSGGPSDSGSTATTTKANELLIGGHVDANNGNATAAGSFTNIESGGQFAGRFCLSDLIVAATGGYNATFTLQNAVIWGAAIVTVYDAGAVVGPAVTPFITVLEGRRVGY